MKLIIATDDRNGIAFHHKRQSQDRILREEILNLSSDARLWMNTYTYRLFAGDAPAHIRVDESFLEKAAPDDYCFVENLSVKPYADKIESIVVFKWNRKYPGDLFFDIDLADGGWKLENSKNFAGSSHEKISMEVYRKCGKQ